MTIDVRPDPGHPHGGFARLGITGGALAGDTAEVEVFDSFVGRYLGPTGWQATRFAFGPYPVERTGGEVSVRVGPEIVNQLNEYQTVRLTLGPVQADLSWPDDVFPAPAAAIPGEIVVGDAPAPAPKPAPLKAPLPEPVGANQGAEPTEPPPLTVVDPKPPSRLLLALGALALVALLAAGAGYFLLADREAPPEAAAPEETPAPQAAPAPQEPPAPPEAPPPAEVEADAHPPAPPSPPEPDCSTAALTGLAGGGFTGVADRLRLCGAAIAPDAALPLLEQAARDNDPAALTLFGRLYDETATDTPLETDLGLTFPDNPARAAEYYDRAAQAGSTEAGPLRDAVCQRLSTMTDTLSQSAYEDHCGT